MIAAALLAACSPGEAPDASGLTGEEKVALVQRYYACAREQNTPCVAATLHPDFRAAAEAAGADARQGHAEAMSRRLATSRVESRVLDQDGAEVWVVEVWNDKHGATTSLLRNFTFESGLIRAKTVLAT
ncbi:hypothetical protein ACFOMD_12635 [Sphingoaurantiacus capsulatus]|uniref:Nuclear transport factor 2 family protein n=1 Tax=Sphingoaurantiacus capsulatus TaxID=1771310 RepID=A0ABV7XB98_9SPHN